MIILMPVNALVANRIRAIQFNQMEKKDERIKVINELLGGIKVLKLYAWEPIFEKKVMQIRAEEIKLLRRSIYLRCAVSFVWCCAPFLVSQIATPIRDQNSICLNSPGGIGDIHYISSKQ